MKKVALSLSIVFSLFLSACGQDLPMVLDNYKLKEVPIDKSLLKGCSDLVVRKPNADTLTQQQIGQYILDLRHALLECQVDAKTANDIIDQFNKDVRTFNEKNGVKK